MKKQFHKQDANLWIPITVAIIGTIGVIITALITNWDKLFEAQQSKPQQDSLQNNQSLSQNTNAPNSPNVENVNGNVDININTAKSALDIPSFDDTLEPLPGFRRNPQQGKKLNEFMIDHKDEIVFLSIYLTEEMQSDINYVDEDNRRIFTVPNNYDDFTSGGSEYLIHVSEESLKEFRFNSQTGQLSGYFKVWEINGPRQGFMSVNLRPVKFDKN